MHYKRHYLQFRDLVFDQYDMVSEDDASSSFRQYSSSYSFTHGDYVPFKTSSVILDSGNVSLTLILRMTKLPCEQRKYYTRFAKNELTRPGKLWAVQDGDLIWAYAYITNFSTTSSRRDELEIDVSFSTYEGVWHKADKLRTFLHPYNVCDFMDCYDYHDIQPCKTDCCNCDATEPIRCDCCDDCFVVTEDMALCYHTSEIQDFYGCDIPYRIVYDCERAEKFFGDDLKAPYLGQKFCQTCGQLIAGILYSDTDIDTTGVRITIHGQMKNPYVEINGNGNYIKGEYDGELIINPDGSVYYNKSDCRSCEPISVENWVIPAGMDYGWTVHQGNNKLIIDTGVCCSACAYIEVDALTI